MEQRYCMKCMRPTGGTQMCPYCGHVAGETILAAHVLRPGTILDGRYILGEPLGQGGFGITYIGRDRNLDIRVAIKEYFPSGYAIRNVETSDSITITDERMRDDVQKGKERFLQEAQTLAQFKNTPGIVDVLNFFKANNTAYIVMEYLDGETLSRRLRRNLFTANEIFRLMDPIFDTLEKVHQQGVIHRDISPDNIMIMPDGSLKLMDFGAARLMNYVDQRSVSVVLKAGYAPLEQYSTKGEQGPWTDVYALCATIYKCITGKTPADPHDRLMGEAVPWPSELGLPISVRQENALKKGMAIFQKDRFQTIGELRSTLRKEDSDSMESGPITTEPARDEVTFALPKRPSDKLTKVTDAPVADWSKKAKGESAVDQSKLVADVSADKRSKEITGISADVEPTNAPAAEKEPDRQTASPRRKNAMKKRKSALFRAACAALGVAAIALIAAIIWSGRNEKAPQTAITTAQAIAGVESIPSAEPEQTPTPGTTQKPTSISTDSRTPASTATPISTSTDTPTPTLKPALSIEAMAKANRRKTIAAGGNHTVALRADGTVLAIGSYDNGECQVSDWRDIVSVAAGVHLTMGLKADGTVTVSGYEVKGGYADYFDDFVSDWTGIVAIAAGSYNTVGLTADGTVVDRGFYGGFGVSGKDIVAIASGVYHTVGLKADGTVVANGNNDKGQCDVDHWTDIVAIAACADYTVGLKADGTVVAVGDYKDGECDVNDWTDIVAIAAGGSHAVGLKADGTVVAMGNNEDGQCNVFDWTDIVAIAAGSYHTVGLKADGTMIATGRNNQGQCDVSDWKDIRMPDVTLVSATQQTKAPTPPTSTPTTTPTSTPAHTMVPTPKPVLSATAIPEIITGMISTAYYANTNDASSAMAQLQSSCEQQKNAEGWISYRITSPELITWHLQEEGEEYIAYANNVGGYNINVTTLENGVVMVTYDVDVWYIEAYFDYYEHY